jgi:hypothetical protein
MKLMKISLERQTYVCGTAQAGRKNWPREFMNPKSLKLSRGECKKIATTECYHHSTA